MWTVIQRVRVCLRASVLLSRVCNVKLCLFNISTHNPQSHVTVIILLIAKYGALHKLPICTRTQPGP